MSFEGGSSLSTGGRFIGGRCSGEADPSRIDELVGVRCCRFGRLLDFLDDRSCVVERWDYHREVFVRR